MLLLPLSTAIIVSVAWGLSLIVMFSYYMARMQKINPWNVIAEHFLIAVLVIVATHFVGDWIGG